VPVAVPVPVPVPAYAGGDGRACAVDSGLMSRLLAGEMHRLRDRCSTRLRASTTACGARCRRRTRSVHHCRRLCRLSSSRLVRSQLRCGVFACHCARKSRWVASCVCS
jgi:hypothetical protein